MTMPQRNYDDLVTRSPGGDVLSLNAAQWLPQIQRWLADLGMGPEESEQLAPQVFQRALLLEEGPSASRLRELLQRTALDVFSVSRVEAAQSGDGRAVHELLDAWQAEILRWCRWQAPPGASPDDIAHDVFVTVLTRLRTVREPERFRSWLWGITWRTVQGRRRKAWFRRWVPGEVERHEDVDSGASQLAERSERSQLVARVLEGLNGQQRQLLWLCYVEGQTRREMVELLGMPEGTLNRKLTAARRAFEKQARKLGVHPDHADPGRKDPSGARR